MLNAISPSTTSSYLAAQKSTKSLFLSLPLEIQEEVENHLPVAERLNFYKALITVTRDGEPMDSPALKLHLLQERIAAKYHQSLASSDESLRAFALNQLQKLEESGQLDQVVEKHALFELVRRVDDPKLFEYLREKIQQVLELKQTLLSWVERSKVEEVQTVAANALTLLVKTGVQLSEKDFSGIRVPGADLSYGMFGLTKFQNADLSGVDWTCAWLRGVNLDGADLARSQFGEKPGLEMNKGISACCYSPDGRRLAVAEDNQIQLYETESLSQLHTYVGHEKKVLSIAFASNGKWLASGSYTGTVRIWSVLTNDCQAVLQSFTGPIQAVTWQPVLDDDTAILCTKGEGFTLCFWRVFSNAGQISKIVLDRMSGQDTTTLTATGALIENARNLNPQNAVLLRQRGAKQTQISELHS